MNNLNNKNIVSTVHDYICCGVTPHPRLYFQYLSELYEQSKQQTVSLTPLGLLEYYNLKINFQIRDKINERQRIVNRRRTRKVA